MCQPSIDAHNFRGVDRVNFRVMLLVFAAGKSLVALGAPTVVRVTPQTVPAHIQVEVTALGCDTKS